MLAENVSTAMKLSPLFLTDLFTQRTSYSLNTVVPIDDDAYRKTSNKRRDLY